MEADPGKQRSRQKRRDRALQLQQEKQTKEEDVASGHDDHDNSPPRSSKDKLPRSKPKKGKSSLFEEDIIDGFAILSFKTLEELEIVTKKNGCIKDKPNADEDISFRDTNSQEGGNKPKKKKKINKNASLDPSTNNVVDIRENVVDNKGNSALNISDSNCANPSSNSELDGSSSGIHVEKVVSSDLIHHQNNSAPSELLLTVAGGMLSNRDVDIGDCKTSDSGSSDVYTGLSVTGILNHLSSNPCEALTAPTPPPSTSTTPTTLCNEIGGPGNPYPSPVHQVLVATTTTTTNTTTSSTSKAHLGDSLTTSTAVTTAVSAAALPSQSVINSSAYLPDYKGSKPSTSPGLSFSPNHNKGSLSPTSNHHYHHHHHHHHHHNHQDGNSCVGDSSSCARSLQYSRVHKSSQPQCTSKDAPPQLSPNNVTSDSNQFSHRPHPQHFTSDSLRPPHLQNGPSNLNNRTSDPTQGPHKSGLLNHEQPSPLGFSRPPVVRLEPHHNHRSSPHSGIDSRHIDQISNNSSSLLASNGIHAASSTTASPLTSTSRNHQDAGVINHHRTPSSSSSSSSSSIKPYQPHHKHSIRDRPSSPCGHQSKRVCKTPTTASIPSGHSTSFSDSSRQLTAGFSPRSHGGKSENLTSYREKERVDKLKAKEATVDGHYHIHLNNHSRHGHGKDYRDREREKERDREKVAVSQGLSLHTPAFPAPKPTWPSAPGPLYSSLIQPHHHNPLTPSSTLHSLVSSHPSSAVTSHVSPLLPISLAPAPPPPPLLAAGTPTLSTGMFAPPIHPAPPSLSSVPPLPTHSTVPGQFSAESLIRGQDFLHQDLSNRLLAHHDSSSIALPPSPFVRSETHQHQHQHLHNHMHQHTYGGLSAGPLVPPGPPLFDKIPKSFEAGVLQPNFDKLPKAFEAGVFRPSIVPSYSAAFASLLPPAPSGTSLASSLHGAFQPKKQGRWCAAHVRVAWEIYHRQQKKLQKDSDGALGPSLSSSSSSSSSMKPGSDAKPLEPLLRPTSHLISGGAPSSRPPDSSLLSSVARGLPDGISHGSSSFLSSAGQLGLSPFPRPSPYPPPSLLNPLGFSGLGSSMFAPVHDIPPVGLSTGLSSSPHEWSRLHRTPSSFPSWPKSDADRDKDREKDRERELRKEEDSYRDRRGSVSHQMSGLEDPRLIESSRPKSRSRSRSPLVNGRIDHHGKSDLGPYDKRPHSATSSVLKMKDERREDELSTLPHHLAEREKRERLERDRLERDRFERERIEKEKLLHNAAVAEREKVLQAVEQREKFFQASGYLGLNPIGAGLHAHPGLLDRRVGLMAHPGAAYPFLDRPPVPASMWSPFDKSAEMAHRLEVERERERMALMSRLSSIPSQMAALEQERMKEQILREQQEREYEIRRQYLDRLPSFNADRLRAVDPLALGTYFPRTISPMFGPGSLAGLKSNSPHGLHVAPPPLIHSSSTVASSMLSRSHDSSPSSTSKSKGCSPADSTSDLKDKRDGGSTDPDAHLR